MAIFRGDARAKLEQARMETDLRRKVELLEDGLDETLRELGYVLTTLGAENFSPEGLKQVREGK